jgi:hypothetical protein
MDEDKVMLTVRVPKDLRRRMRRYAIDKDTTIQEMVTEWCGEKLAKIEAAKR